MIHPAVKDVTAIFASVVFIIVLSVTVPNLLASCTAVKTGCQIIKVADDICTVVTFKDPVTGETVEEQVPSSVLRSAAMQARAARLAPAASASAAPAVSRLLGYQHHGFNHAAVRTSLPDRPDRQE
jgi:hypothetical protein